MFPRVPGGKRCFCRGAIDWCFHSLLRESVLLFKIAMRARASLRRRGLFFSGAKEEISRLAVPAANEADFDLVPIFFRFFSIRLLVVTSKCFSP